MAFMQTKSCCCGCDLKTGTWILLILIAIINGAFFYYSISSSSSSKPSYDDVWDYSYSRHPNSEPKYNGSGISVTAVMIELVVFACCASAGYSMKKVGRARAESFKDKRMFLIPFMVIIIGIFVCMLLVSMAAILAAVGISSLMNSFSEATSFSSLFNNMDKNQQNKRDFDLTNAIGGPFTIIIVVISLINIVIFLHFVKVVCCLFAEMGKPNGIILPPTSPASMNCSYYPNIS